MKQPTIKTIIGDILALAVFAATMGLFSYIGHAAGF